MNDLHFGAPSKGWPTFGPDGKVVRDEPVHRCPVGDDGLTPCCGVSPAELPTTARMTTFPQLVTCTGGAP